MRYSVLTIEREYASGGSEIGRMVAARRKIPCYGNEVLRMAAQQIGIAPENVEHLDETAPNSLLYSLAAMARPITFGDTTQPQENILQHKEAEVIWRFAAKDSCVLIGRRAGAILKDNADVLRVFIHANNAYRKKRAIESYGVPADEAESVLKRYDRRRANYYNFYSAHRWDDKAAYHLMLDSSSLGPERCAEIILAAME